METTALICNEQQEFSLEKFLLPSLGDKEILIKTTYSGVSIGTELALVRNKISWGPYPICTGYQSVGIVEEVGKKVSEFKEGDMVFSRGNQGALQFKNGTNLTNASGSHASKIINSLDDIYNLPGKVPEGTDLKSASMFVMPSVALQGLELSSISSLESVAVYGVGQIGLGVVALASLRGCKVIALDINDKSLQIARKLGADYTINTHDEHWEDQFKSVFPFGVDAAFECTGINACIEPTMNLVKFAPHDAIHGQGKFIYQGNYGSTISHSFRIPHGRNIRAFYPCNDGLLPKRERIMKLLQIGALKWEHVITHTFSWDESPEIFSKINKGSKEMLGVVFDWTSA